jgi:D-alanyl-lipoteichoic acid acyltransferase DltB (MBOAT superfamily)
VVFPTIEFAAFFLVVLTGSWLLMPHPRLWKPFVLAASFFFYGYADVRFTLLLVTVTLVNQAAALAVHRWQDSRFVVAAVVADLGLLGWFKYYGFFALSVDSALDRVGLGAPLPLLQVALPVGISFYTFQAISYVVDVHRRELRPARTVDFAVYQAFFPHLVAGPIVRASEFLPQLATPRDPRRVPTARAFFLLSGGLIKKIVIADLIATRLVDPVFAVPGAHSQLEILAAIYGYAVQIYCDFSAYSDMAIGLALLLGFRFPDNFDRPYSAASLQEFWRRWHMTLSRWLRDYLYVGLGGNRGGRRRTYRNLLLTMLLGGLWHGAAWTFVVWGGIHGAGLAIERALRDRGQDRREPTSAPVRASGWAPDRSDRSDPPARAAPGRGGTAVLDAPRTTPARASAPAHAPAVLGWLVTFHVVCLAWVFFRAPDLSTAFTLLGRLLSAAGPAPLVTPSVLAAIAVGLATQFVSPAVWARARIRFARLGIVAQGACLAAVIVACNALVGEQGVAPFIYFRF